MNKSKNRINTKFRSNSKHRVNTKRRGNTKRRRNYKRISRNKSKYNKRRRNTKRRVVNKYSGGADPEQVKSRRVQAAHAEHIHNSILEAWKSCEQKHPGKDIKSRLGKDGHECYKKWLNDKHELDYENEFGDPTDRERRDNTHYHDLWDSMNTNTKFKHKYSHEDGSFKECVIEPSVDC